MQVREESDADSSAVRIVHEQAFRGDTEPRLVEMLRESGRVVLSLVAMVANQVVGHTLFSPVTIDVPSGDSRWAALGPIGVLPDYQGRGIGSRLVREGLAGCRERGCDAVVLLGEPEYYSRFGFVPASEHRLTSEYGAGPAFQAVELIAGSLGVSSETRVVYYGRRFRDGPMGEWGWQIWLHGYMAGLKAANSATTQAAAGDKERV